MIFMIAMLKLCGLSCANSFKFIIESAKRDRFIINMDLCHPLQPIFTPAHPNNPRIIPLRERKIFRVFIACHIPKIRDSIIIFGVVNMVYLLRPNTVNIKPSKSMCRVYFFTNRNPDIPASRLCFDNASLDSVTLHSNPSKLTSIWVVMQIFFKLFLSNNEQFSVKNYRFKKFMATEERPLSSVMSLAMI